MLLRFLTMTNIGLLMAITVVPMDEICLDCICKALSYNCVNPGCGIDNNIQYCGPYYLHYAYWKETGEAGGDFMSCVTNLTCAKQTVTSYMKIYQRDCDNSGYIDCGDYFKIHRVGRNDCHKKSIEEEPYWLKFLECYLNNVKDPRNALRMLRRIL